ncbi:hypothetical protein HPB50_021142 [Hyalomma asiaticum]|uniref:Uncharacterized protein n=1 Tax=Hyalomma asiaticum TaxID=266040 RepID=A0ACB7TNS2_HYAAI|nr:hypothetical protein HPB50_021142 [Hyalomma asiaticum]
MDAPGAQRPSHRGIRDAANALLHAGALRRGGQGPRCLAQLRQSPGPQQQPRKKTSAFRRLKQRCARFSPKVCPLIMGSQAAASVCFADDPGIWPQKPRDRANRAFCGCGHAIEPPCA